MYFSMKGLGHWLFVFVVFLLVPGSTTGTFQVTLARDLATRSSFRQSSHENVSTILKDQRTSLPPVDVAGLLGNRSSSDSSSVKGSALLVLFHDCFLPWAVRIESLTNALVALESRAIAFHGSPFDVLVHLNKPAQLVSRQQCKQSLGMIQHEEEPGVSPRLSLYCDCHQLLRQAKVAFLQGRERSPGVARYEALQYAKQHGYQTLVFATTASLLPPSTVSSLAQSVHHLSSSTAIVVPILDDEAGPEVSNTVKLSSFHQIKDQRLHSAASHPLNFNLVAKAVVSTVSDLPLLQRVRWKSKDSLTATLHRVCAMSVDTAQSLVSQHDHKGHHLDLSRASLESVAVLTNAFAISRSDPTALLSNRPNSASIPTSIPTSDQRSSTLVAATCAGVWPRTLSLLLSLESETLSDFDFMLAVTPRSQDTTAAFARLAGYQVYEQPRPVGLTDLWNKVLQYAITHGYRNVFLINNDVLIGNGAVRALVSLLDSTTPFEIAIPMTRRGAGAIELNLYAKPEGTPENNFFSNPLSFQRIQSALNERMYRNQFVASQSGGWVAFFFGMKVSFVKKHLLADGSQRLWNDTRWKNYNQEKDLMSRTRVRIGVSSNAFVYHYRGSTLTSGDCKNGWLDCAKWQEGHRPDMKSDWWDPANSGL